VILLRILVLSVQLILLGLVPAANLTPIYLAAPARALEIDSRLADLLRRHAAPAESGTIVPDSESP
jgi:hypothetical protein